MPLYEYKCKECGRHTEKRQKFSDPEITHCPHCNGPLERVISAPAVSFKGSGWYKDLYSSPKPSAKTSPSETSSSSEASSSSNSSSSSGDSSSSSPSSSAPASPAPAASSSTPTSSTK